MQINLLEKALAGVWRFADATFPLQVCVWPSAGTELGGASTCAPPTSPSARAGPQTYAEFILVRHT